MKATLGSENSSAVNYGVNKELVSTWNVIVNSNDGLKNIITARCYMGRSASASTVHASIWVHSTDHQTSGTGKAGGYGYHKASAAIAEAIKSAGIELDEDISGRGDSAIEESLEAIAATLGFESCLIVQN
jgi:hypothetical protein